MTMFCKGVTFQPSGMLQNKPCFTVVKHKNVLVLLLAAAAFALLPTGATAARQMDGISFVTDKSGRPVDTQTTVRFALYPAQDKGSQPLWQETQDLRIERGVLRFTLGAATELPLLTTRDLYLGITLGSDSEMTPRKRLAPVFAAYNALSADTLAGRVPGTNPGNLAVLGADGRIARDNLPSDLVLDNDKRLKQQSIKLSVAGSSYLTVSGQKITAGKIDLTSDTQGALASVNGGTGLTSYAAGDLLYASATDTLGKLTAGTTGQLLAVSGTGVPTWINPASVGAVSSVFGRTGTVTAQAGDYTTDQVTEGTTNLYHTQARARAALSAVSPIAYSSTTGAISWAGTTDDVTEGVTNLYYTDTRFTTTLATKTTDDLTEGTTNLYYTDERVDDRTATLTQNGTGISWTYNDAANTLTPTVSLASFTTDNLAEGATNLYYTDTRADARVTALFPNLFDTRLATKTTDNLTEGTTNLYYTQARARAALSAVSPIAYSSTTGAISWTGTTDDLTEGTTNLYYTDERVDDRTATLIQNGTGITWSYNDVANTLTPTIALGSFTTDNLAEGTTNLYYTTTRVNSAFDTRLATKTTDNLAEGTTNLYWTTTRGNANFAANLAARTTDDLTEGATNLYYTQARARAALSAVSPIAYSSTTGAISWAGTTDDVTEGVTNLYYTDTRFTTTLATKTTDNLTEGTTNLYYTTARARAALSATSPVTYNSTSGAIGLGTVPVTSGGTGTTTAFTQGSVVFAGASGVYSQNNANFFWDNTNSRLGIGTAAPTAKLEVRSNYDQGGTAQLRLTDTTSSGTASPLIEFFNTAANKITARERVVNGSGFSPNMIFDMDNGSGTLNSRFVIGGASNAVRVLGRADTAQFVVQANSTQSVSNPLIKATYSNGTEGSDGTELFRISTNVASNFFAGYQAGNAVTTGTWNTFVGGSAGVANTTGTSNTAFGFQSLLSNTIGTSNTANGVNALYSNVAKNESTAIGYNAMYYADSSATSAITYNTAVGAYALRGSTTASANTGTRNTALGHSALYNMTSGGDNIGIGSSAGWSMTTGYHNISMGTNSAYNQTTGSYNIAIGSNAGGRWAASTGSYNTTVGADSGNVTGTATQNATFGYQAGSGINGGSYNAFFGNGAGITSGAGNNNVALGYWAGANRTGSNNIFLGYQAGYNGTVAAGNNNIAIGYNVNLPSVAGSNQLTIGNLIFGTGLDGTGTTVSTGNVGIGVTNPGQKLQVAGNIRNSAPSYGYIELSGDLPGNANGLYPTLKTSDNYLYFSVGGNHSSHIAANGVYTVNSSRTRKENFVTVDQDDILAKIDMLPMMSWNYIDEDPDIRHIAPIAQDFTALFHLNGPSDTMISSIDPSGVALVGVKALSSKVSALSTQLQVSATTQADLQNQINASFSLLGNRIDTMELAQTTLAADLAAATQALTSQTTRLDTIDTQIAALQQSVTVLNEFYLALDLGNVVTRAADGSVDLLGSTVHATVLSADTVAAKEFVIDTADTAEATAGTATILPVTVDADNDGVDDETGSDGVTVTVATSAVHTGDRIFLTVRDVPIGVAPTDVVDGEGFTIRIAAPQTAATKVDWWIVR